MVDAGRISWDDKVTDRLPGFQMYDPWVTREMTIRDLLVHRSGLGLGQGDLMMVPRSNISRAELVGRIGRYAGTYVDPWYGRIAVGGSANGLTIDFTSTPRMAGRLEHWQYDTFVTRFDDKAIEPAYVTFGLDADGRVDRVTMKPVNPVIDFSWIIRIWPSFRKRCVNEAATLPRAAARRRPSGVRAKPRGPRRARARGDAADRRT